MIIKLINVLKNVCLSTLSVYVYGIIKYCILLVFNGLQHNNGNYNKLFLQVINIYIIVCYSK